MVKLTVTYPNKPGSRFDADYYLNVHMPMSVKLLGYALTSVTADIGISGEDPGSPAPYAAIAGFTCESAEKFIQAFTAVADQLQSDVPNYTDIEPVIQFSNLTEFSLAPE